MRRIVQQLNPQEIGLHEITDDSHIGIDWGSTKSRVMTINSEEFTGLNTSDTDLRSKWTCSSKKSYVQSCLGQGDQVRAYVFDSEQDLLEWSLKSNINN